MVMSPVQVNPVTGKKRPNKTFGSTDVLPDITTIPTPDEDLLYKEYTRTGGQFDFNTWKTAGTPLRPGDEYETLSASLRNIYPERYTSPDKMETVKTSQQLVKEIETNPSEFYSDLQVFGRTPATENILKSFGAGDEEINQIFTPVNEYLRQSITEFYKEKKQFEPAIFQESPEGENFVAVIDGKDVTLTLKPDMSIWEGKNQIGSIDTETGEFKPVDVALWKKILGGVLKGVDILNAPLETMGRVGVMLSSSETQQAYYDELNINAQNEINQLLTDRGYPAGRVPPELKTEVDAIQEKWEKIYLDRYGKMPTPTTWKEAHEQYHNLGLWEQIFLELPSTIVAALIVNPVYAKLGLMAKEGNFGTRLAAKFAKIPASFYEMGSESGVIGWDFSKEASEQLEKAALKPLNITEDLKTVLKGLGKTDKDILLMKPGEAMTLINNAIKTGKVTQDMIEPLSNVISKYAPKAAEELKKPVVGITTQVLSPETIAKLKAMNFTDEDIKLLNPEQADRILNIEVKGTVQRGREFVQSEMEKARAENLAKIVPTGTVQTGLPGLPAIKPPEPQTVVLAQPSQPTVTPPPTPPTPPSPPISPPPVPPVKPPTTVSPSNPIVPPVQPQKEIDRIIEQTQKSKEINKPRLLTRAMLHVPGLRQFLQFERPELKALGDVEKGKLYVGMEAEQAARADVSIWALSSRLGKDGLFANIKRLFGNDSLRGGKVTVEFLGTPEQAKNPITGTLKDIMDNPELYKLNDDQKGFIEFTEIRNNQLLDWVVDGYDAEIGRFVPKPGGAYLPNVDIGDDVIEYLGSETRAVATGRGKTRVWQTARERMAGKTPFTPELDVQKLIEGIDSYKASVAGGQTFRKALGGLTKLEAIEKTHPELYERMMGLRKNLQSLQGSAGRLDEKLNNAVDTFLKSAHNDEDLITLAEDIDVKLATGKRAGMDIKSIQTEIDAVRAEIKSLRPAWETANLKPYVFIQEGIFRYFPSDTAKLVKESRQITNNPILKFLEGWRAGAFSGDLSPLGQQGVIGVLANPVGSLKAGVGAVQSASQRGDFLYAVKMEALAEDIAKDPELWAQYASLSGRALTGTPREYAAGFLSKIPGFDKFTEATYITVTRQSFDLWKRTYEKLIKSGIDDLTAKVVAADLASEVYPLLNPAKLGQSSARAALLRALPTSMSFIRQPVTMIADATTGLAKLTTLGKVPLSAKESLALKTVLTIAASVMVTSATSAYLSAKAKGKSDEEVLQDVLDSINPDPNNGRFASIIIGDTRIPLGGPYRAIFRAIYPKKVEGIDFPVPFAGIPDYLKNRINPALSTQLDLVRNVDYYNKQIRKGETPEAIVRALLYEIENVLPLSLGTVMEDIRTDKTNQIRQDVISQFMGVNAVNMDDTYFKRQIRLLGTQVTDPNPDPDKINVPQTYTTKDLWGDVVQYIRDKKPDELKFLPDLVKRISEVIPIDETVTKLPNNKLVDIDTSVYVNGNVTGLTQRQNASLKEYQDLETLQERYNYLKVHPDLVTNPRKEYLKSHPDENAKLAVWGQEKPLTQKAYDLTQKLVQDWDIPDAAVKDLKFTPPTKKDLITDKIKVEDFIYNQFGDEKLSDYITDKTKREKAVEDFLKAHQDYADDRRRVYAYSKQETYNTQHKTKEDVPDNIVELYVQYFQQKVGRERNSFKVYNPDLYMWGIKVGIWEDPNKGGTPGGTPIPSGELGDVFQTGL